MKRYLICSADESVKHWEPVAVLAESAEAALKKYLEVVYSKDQNFRDSVLDLSVNMSFVEQFYLSSEHEQDRFNATGKAGTEDEIIYSRVKKYFLERTDLGEKFIRYMKTKDASLIDDDMFSFIASDERAESHGVVVLDPELISLVAM